MLLIPTTRVTGGHINNYLKMKNHELVDKLISMDPDAEICGMSIDDNEDFFFYEIKEVEELDDAAFFDDLARIKNGNIITFF